MPDDRTLALAHLADGRNHANTARLQYEAARDLLNREPPARHVAVAITELETAELWVDRAIAGLRVSLAPAPPQGEAPVETARIARPEQDVLVVVFDDGTTIRVDREDGRPVASYGFAEDLAPAPTVSGGGFDRPAAA